jgi:Bacterial protein of unknown function (Gcw_chp)
MSAAPALAQAPAATRQSLTPAAEPGISRAAASLTAAPAAAAQAAAPSKPYTLTAGADFPTAYLFRGIFQEDEGFIFQPWVDLGVDLHEGVTLNVGSWNSIHSGPSGGENNDNDWYETDFYASVSFSSGKFSPGVLFTSYNSPGDAFGTVNELALVLPYDDSDSAFALNPKAVLAFELSGQADGGDHEGIYLELGVKPSIATGTPVTISVPAKFGLSLKDYYEGPYGSDVFGYFTTGASASVALPSSNSVSWEVHGGVDFYWLGDNMKYLNHDDRFKPIGTIGFSLSY